MATKKKQQQPQKKSSAKKLDSIQAAAAALAKGDVVRLAFDPLEAKWALSTGLKALAKHRAALKKNFPGFDLAALDETGEIAVRLRKAQDAVHSAGQPKNVLSLVQRALGFRRQLIGVARSLAERALIDVRVLTKIEDGTGQTDNLNDIEKLAKLLEPVRARVDAALEAGILELANSAAAEALGAQGDGAEDLSTLTDARDRLATLVVQRHERMRAAMAAVTSMSEAVNRVPSLTGRTNSAAPAPQPY
ncbi:MAG: hypothetical protein ACO1OB_30375 [Archangium sp.]